MSEIPVTMPADTNEGTQSIVGQWLKDIGDVVSENEPLLEITTDKVTIEIASPAAGVLRQIIKGTDTEVAPGDVLGMIESEGALTEASSTPLSASSEDDREVAGRSPAPQSTELSNDHSSRGVRSPAVAHLIRTHHLEAEKIPGTGAGGRVTARDVERFIEGRKGKPTLKASGERSRRVPHSPMRRMIATNMSESVRKAPHVTSLFEVDLTKVIEHRAQMKEEFLARGTKLTFTPYFVRAAVHALQEVPEVNSRWHDDALEIFEECNIGIGTALETSAGDAGLVVPVIHGTEQLDLFAIASTLQDLTARARTNTLTAAEVQGGTFTISNHGVSGSLLAAPIIIPPSQSAILGIGKLEKRVVVEEIGGRDAMVIKPMAYVTLTIDHRVLDGFKANAFLTAFTEYLESGSF